MSVLAFRLKITLIFKIKLDLHVLIVCISSSDLKSRPTLIRGQFCLHDVVRETLHSACATVGKKVTTTQFSVSSCQGENIEVQASKLCKIVSNMQLITFSTIPK